MDGTTLNALKQSIEKWERNAVAETPEDYRTRAVDCALCGLFWSSCDGCPVEAKAGYPDCGGTPYAEAAIARWKWLNHRSDAALRDAAHAAARAEAKFLRSLLPEEETAP